MTGSTIKKVFSYVKKIFSTIVLIIVLYAVIGNMAALNNTLYNVVHFRNYVVLTGSMEPGISPGDYVTVLKINPDKLKEGDIVTYIRENTTVTHQIVSIDGDKVITQGTANNIADDPITKDNIVGKYIFKIPRVGYIMKFMSSFSGIILIVGFVAIVIFWEVTDPNRGKNRKDANMSDEKAGLAKEDILREIIFDNLKEMGRLSKDDEQIITSENDIDKLNRWSRISAKTSSIGDFFEQIQSEETKQSSSVSLKESNKEG